MSRLVTFAISLVVHLNNYFFSVRNITGDSQDFPTISVVIGVCTTVSVVAVFLIVTGGGCFWYHKKNKHDGNEPQYAILYVEF